MEVLPGSLKIVGERERERERERDRERQTDRRQTDRRTDDNTDNMHEAIAAIATRRILPYSDCVSHFHTCLITSRLEGRRPHKRPQI